jgi:hypothetical protein
MLLDGRVGRYFGCVEGTMIEESNTRSNLQVSKCVPRSRCEGQ